MKINAQYRVASVFGGLALLIGVFGGVLIGLDSTGSWRQFNAQKTEKDKQAQQIKDDLTRQKQIADEAIKNKVGLYDQIKVSDWTANPTYPPNVNWSITPSSERKTVLDRADACVGYVQDGIFYSIYDYQNYQGIQYKQDACSKENRTK